MSSPLPTRTQQARAAAAYATQSRECSADDLILQYLPLVRHVANKVCGNLSAGLDMDDLISAGTLGLVQAAHGYDPSRQADFKTYAYIRVRGAIIDELRGRSFVPVGVQQQIQAVKRAYQDLTARLGRPPDDGELAGELGIELAALYGTLEEARRRNFLSIHGLSEEEPALGRFLPANDEPNPHAQAERTETLERLRSAIKELPERDRLILLLYYERDLTMKETAAVLEVTESRVSQLHASALFKLSMMLRAES